MLRHVECQRYRQWKKQQDALLKGPKRKIKKIKKKERKEITDCIEEEKQEKPKTILRIRYRKCIQKEKQKPKRRPMLKPRPVSSVDLLFKRIQPSLEVRYQLLADRHADCFAEAVSPTDITVLRKATSLKTRTKIAKADVKRKRSRRRKKDKVEKTISDFEEGARRAEEERADEEQQEESLVNEQEEEEEAKEEGEVVETTDIEGKENVRGEDDVGDIDEKRKRKVKRKKKDKFWCEKFKRKIDFESEVSECESICSFDSDICLKGLALTVEDKKKIEENRRQVRASSAA